MAANNWLLDTSILVDLMRGSKSARDWIVSIPQDARAISVITAAELLAGCRNRAEQRALERELKGSASASAPIHLCHSEP